MSAPSVAIVTGAASGLGLELAVRLAHEGPVVGVARTDPEDQRWAASDCHFVRGDVADPDTVERAFGEAEAHGALSLVVNCAGRGVFGPAGTGSRAALDEVLAGNLVGLVLFSEAAFARFRETGGTIVNVMSTAAKTPRANESLYCAAKWGARGYTESLRLDAAGSQARIVAVYPGGMRTRFWRRAEASHVDPARFMDPADVAEAILAALPRGVSELVIARC
ncbi:MAG TPA: SDR family oxidoreductase [Gaiellaceae bacterium]|nr:SDR family oxidoreductase [Gaiellaceae bacterium]